MCFVRNAIKQLTIPMVFHRHFVRKNRICHIHLEFLTRLTVVYTKWNETGLDGNLWFCIYTLSLCLTKAARRVNERDKIRNLSVRLKQKKPDQSSRSTTTTTS